MLKHFPDDKWLGVKKPWYYGVIYYDPTRRETVGTFIPLNLIIAVCRDLYHRILINFGRTGYLEKKIGEYKDSSYDRGYKHGHMVGYSQGQEEERMRLKGHIDYAIDRLQGKDDPV